MTADNGFRSDRVRGDARLEPQNVTFPATGFLSCEHTLMHEEKSHGELNGVCRFSLSGTAASPSWVNSGPVIVPPRCHLDVHPRPALRNAEDRPRTLLRRCRQYSSLMI